VDYKLLNTFFACNVKGDTSCVEFPIDSLFLQSKRETHIPDIGDARCVGASPFSSDTRCVFRGRVSLFLHQKCTHFRNITKISNGYISHKYPMKAIF
jgi:hypothetical protein